MTVSCRHDISWTSRQILTKFAGILHWDTVKSWLGFGDLDLIFKVTAGLALPNFNPEIACLHYVISWTIGWNVTKFTCLYYWGRVRKRLDFGILDLIFKVTWSWLKLPPWFGWLGNICFLWKHLYFKLQLLEYQIMVNCVQLESEWRTSWSGNILVNTSNGSLDLKKGLFGNFWKRLVLDISKHAEKGILKLGKGPKCTQ